MKRKNEGNQWCTAGLNGTLKALLTSWNETKSLFSFWISVTRQSAHSNSCFIHFQKWKYLRDVAANENICEIRCCSDVFLS
jgi:hypothetical protein